MRLGVQRLMLTMRWLAVAAVGLIVIAGAAIYLPSALQPSTTSGSSTTITSTTSGSSTTITSTTFTTCTTTGSFSYSPNSPVKIDDVRAMVYQGTGSERIVTFTVSFENTGASPVYVVSGCGSGLTASLPANSPVLQKVTSGPVCECAAFIAAIDPGQNRTSVTPGCWSGYHYRLVQPGTVTVNFTLSWGTNGQSFQESNSTTISATFTFS